MSRELKFPEAEETAYAGLAKHIVIPTAWAVGVLAGLLINAGILYQQFSAMKDGNLKSDVMIALIRENQIKGLSELSNLVTNVQNHENRIVVIEKYVINKESK